MSQAAGGSLDWVCLWNVSQIVHHTQSDSDGIAQDPSKPTIWAIRKWNSGRSRADSGKARTGGGHVLEAGPPLCYSGRMLPLPLPELPNEGPSLKVPIAVREGYGRVSSARAEAGLVLGVTALSN